MFTITVNSIIAVQLLDNLAYTTIVNSKLHSGFLRYSLTFKPVISGQNSLFPLFKPTRFSLLRFLYDITP